MYINILGSGAGVGIGVVAASGDAGFGMPLTSEYTLPSRCASDSAGTSASLSFSTHPATFRTVRGVDTAMGWSFWKTISIIVPSAVTMLYAYRIIKKVFNAWNKHTLDDLNTWQTYSSVASKELAS